MKLFKLGLLWLAASDLAILLVAASPAHNQLTEEEQAAGWELVFNGRDTAQWRNFGRADFPKTGWEIQDGCLHLVPKAMGGDIITRSTYRDFEFIFDWKLAPKSNSGVKYFILEERKAAIGHEYQLYDDPNTSWKAPGKGDVGSFYDVLPPTPYPSPIRAGEFHQSRIKVEGKNVEHWLDGRLVLAYELGSPTVRTALQKSKFKDVKGFGESQDGHILLQDHGGEVWFRDLKIRRLTAPK